MFKWWKGSRDFVLVGFIVFIAMYFVVDHTSVKHASF